MKRLAIFIIAAAMSAAGAVPLPENEAKLAVNLSAIFAQAAEQYRGLVKQMEGQANPFPKSWKDGKLVTITPQNWCSGFFPGSLWYLYEYTKADDLKVAAEKFTAIQEQIRHYAGNHDIGFMLMTSVGNALRLAPKPEYKNILLDGAAALATRYDDKLGLIRSWNNGKGKGRMLGDHYLVIVDNMMNLELLEWAAKNGGDQKLLAVAKSHADKTNLNHFRPDSSAYHIIDYNPENGKIFSYRAGQGASADGTWARGQAWATYGFTMMYRETKAPAYLERAMRCADYVLSAPNLPADKVTYWDFKAPNIPNEERDTSAAAIFASAFLELSAYVPRDRAHAYRSFAVRSLLTLASPAYFAKVGENGGFLLKHGVANKPGGGDVDAALNYGDYYFLEALVRFWRMVEG